MFVAITDSVSKFGRSHASIDEQEQIIIGVASGKVSRIELGERMREHVVVRNR